MTKTLICTLGTEAQVVTMTLHLLTQKGEQIDKVCVIHTDNNYEPLKSAIETLTNAIDSLFPEIIFESVIFSDGVRLLSDTSTEEELEIAFRNIYNQVQKAKKAGETVYLNIAGGRKIMGVYGCTTAQLLFEPQDKLFYLVSPLEVVQSRRLLPGPDDNLRLVSVPIMRWSGAPLAITEIGCYLDPKQAISTINSKAEANFQAKLYNFLHENLTPAEKMLVRTTVANPTWTLKKLGQHLNKKPKIVDAQFQAVYEKLKLNFEINDVSRPTLNRLFINYQWIDE